MQVELTSGEYLPTWCCFKKFRLFCTVIFFRCCLFYFLNCTPDMNMILDCFICTSWFDYFTHQFILRSCCQETTEMRRGKSDTMDKKNSWRDTQPRRRFTYKSERNKIEYRLDFFYYYEIFYCYCYYKKHSALGTKEWRQEISIFWIKYRYRKRKPSFTGVIQEIWLYIFMAAFRKTSPRALTRETYLSSSAQLFYTVT